MSSTLMWKPARPQKQGDLPDQLKRILSRKIWDTDGSMGDGEATVGRSFIPYLEGLRDSGVKGAEELIALIKEHEEVILWHQF